MTNLVYILLDGLNEEASKIMQFAKNLDVYIKYGIFKTVFPPLSKPAYTTLFSGIDPDRHGIKSNSSIKFAPQDNIFTWAQMRGLRTAAAAYYWFFELFNNK